MSSEKSDAIVIRQADFSESSRVLTLFTRDFGKISCLAKGVKRLKTAFEGSLDLLSECRVVFIHKQSSGLDLLTEAQLIKRFKPSPKSLTHLYGGFYIAELLNALTEESDPHPELYQAAADALFILSSESPPDTAIFRFELIALREIGQLPDFETCTICQSEIILGDHSRFWVSESGLICSRCGHSEYQQTEIQSGAIAVIRKLLDGNVDTLNRLTLSDQQRRDIRKLLTSAISSILGRRPKTTKLLGW
ncbi:DNA repair protein RecO [Planctomicrobium sp.]|jgi:DNA repair protein RecO (recombination protein O)|nr:DNA repair protein RecO [Planctomicrobium sp.]MDB4743149.1 DNA repair protein RecO [Planctomicrobium sp.]MDB4802661.1 DNA repair protein RecO [bacterium]